MIIVRITAGLGNQMFQYALFRALIEQDHDSYIDITSYDKNPVHNNYEIGKLFNIDERIASHDQIKKVRRFINEMNLMQRLNRKIKLQLGLNYPHYCEKQFYVFDPEVLKLQGNIYLDGYWQSYKYFEDISGQILNTFTLLDFDKNNISLQNLITNCEESVSVHVRRGDFILNPMHNNISTLQYYNKAFEKINLTLKKPVFFIFSDDIPWCKNHLNFEECYYVTGNEGKDSYKDMQLMAMCKHNIIANSSFSWWGAWLNQHLEKIVIAPNRMVNGGFNFDDVYPPAWELIQV